MSKSAKFSILILILLVVISLGFAGYSLMEKQKISEAKSGLEQELTKSQDREKKNLSEIKELKDQLKNIESQKNDLDKMAKASQQKAQELSSQVDEIGKDRDKWKTRFDQIKQERNELEEKLKNLPPPQIVYRDREVPAPATPQTSQPTTQTSASKPAEVNAEQQGDQYWASVLRAKAELEVKLENLNKELSNRSLDIVDLKQKNADMELEIKNIQSNKEQVAQDLKYKEDLINNLSLELARAKNDRKMTSDKVQGINAENTELRKQVKQLFSTKSNLEKAIVRLTEEKDQISKKLSQVDSVVQSKIDEIWQLKEGVDRTMKASQLTNGSSNNSSMNGQAVDLPPIVVSADGTTTTADKANDNPTPSNEVSVGGYKGNIVSINEENNFAIVDFGEDAGVRLGDTLGVYRDSKYIARLQVIQVRKDICAADIKDQWSKIKAGDSVR